LLNFLNIVSFIQISGICFLIGRRVFRSDVVGILGFLFSVSALLWQFGDFYGSTQEKVT